MLHFKFKSICSDVFALGSAPPDKYHTRSCKVMSRRDNIEDALPSVATPVPPGESTQETLRRRILKRCNGNIGRTLCSKFHHGDAAQRCIHTGLRIRCKSAVTSEWLLESVASHYFNDLTFDSI